LETLLGPLPEQRMSRPWLIVSASLLALLLAIVIAGVLAIIENNRVKEITERALTFDIEVEDEASDVQVAVLGLRHRHRNIVFGGASASTIAEFDEAYEKLLEELGELESLRLGDLGITQPARIRELTDRYYDDFWPAIAMAETEPRAFLAASDIGLSRLEEMGEAADQMDNLGDRLADNSLTRVQGAARTEQLFLFGLIGGALLVGVTLALSAGRILSRLHTLYEREQLARSELARALQAKSDFIADASHELRTPLTVLRGNAEAGLAIDASCAHREFLEEIVEESAAMTRLVGDLLFLARFDATAPPLDVKPVPITQILQTVADRSDVLVRQWGAVLTTHLSGEGTIIADAARIEQAILAIVDNAAKFGGPSSEVELSTAVWNGELLIDVVDQGPGIAEADLPMIFERFYRTSRGRGRGGAGLGLAIARTIVEAHGGRLEVQSRLGHGTRMGIRLPLAGAETLTAKPEEGRREVAQVGPKGSVVRALRSAVRVPLNGRPHGGGPEPKPPVETSNDDGAEVAGNPR
jgi:signal transduction histidine kinase